MIVNIEELKFKTILGILDFERENPQDVVVDLSFEYDFKDDFIDYAKVVEIIKNMMIEKKYLLIEDAILDISSFLRKKFPQIFSIDLKISKPSILADCKVSVRLKS